MCGRHDHDSTNEELCFLVVFEKEQHSEEEKEEREVVGVEMVHVGVVAVIQRGSDLEMDRIRIHFAIDDQSPD